MTDVAGALVGGCRFEVGVLNVDFEFELLILGTRLRVWVVGCGFRFVSLECRVLSF